VLAAQGKLAEAEPRPLAAFGEFQRRWRELPFEARQHMRDARNACTLVRGDRSSATVAACAEPDTRVHARSHDGARPARKDFCVAFF
jgi:hypothetical protein